MMGDKYVLADPHPCTEPWCAASRLRLPFAVITHDDGPSLCSRDAAHYCILIS